MIARPLEERFWEKVDRRGPDECWVWQGARTSGGYGCIRIDNDRVRRAHRVAYEMESGPIPQGLELDHLCRHIQCVNPAHLEPVNHRTNCLRGVGLGAVAAAKTHCPRGHAYDMVDNRGRRRCRVCFNAQHAARRTARRTI